MPSEPIRNTTARWRALDVRHHLSPFADYKSLKQDEGGSRIITQAEGIYLTDSEGHRLLDGMAGLWCVNVGYGRAELAEAAYRQMLELPYYNTFFKTATPPAVELSEKLAEIAPEGLNRAFFGSSGSESNDSVVRLVRRYWNLRGQPEKSHIVSRTYAYHGSTMASASLGGMVGMQEGFGLPLPGFHHVMPPYWFDFAEAGETPADFGRRAAKAVEDKILEIGPDKVGAFIGEPIQGAGGVIIPPETYWPEIQRICSQYDVLLVADEVICGFGRTGRWFASEAFGIAPDLMTLAKGITSGYVPLSAVLVSDKVGEVLESGEGEFAHGYTYSGHPVACAVALANIALIERDGLVEKVRHETGPYLAECLQSLSDHPLVGQVRSFGLLGAIELVEDKASRKHFEPLGRVGTLCRDHCFQNGLVMRAVRDGMVLSPPLIIETAEIDALVETARRCLDLTAKDLGIAL
ncbi:aspartate aminotransferase family protein [Algihabitans albus]|uniref:aspartate aminotransferase family protein n=1 Tax=Algihabitans albus TaxID=2164067 RepID=UPI0035CF6367